MYKNTNFKEYIYIYIYLKSYNMITYLFISSYNQIKEYERKTRLLQFP